MSDYNKVYNREWKKDNSENEYRVFQVMKPQFANLAKHVNKKKASSNVRRAYHK